MSILSGTCIRQIFGEGMEGGGLYLGSPWVNCMVIRFVVVLSSCGRPKINGVLNIHYPREFRAEGSEGCNNVKNSRKIHIRTEIGKPTKIRLGK